MYVSTSKTTKNGKTHITHMLRHSYREDGKVKHRNIGCLNLCSPEELESIKFALKNKKHLSKFQDMDKITLTQGKSFGGVWTVYSMARLLKIDQALGTSQEGTVALLQVLARVIGQGSKLKGVRMQETHALCEILGLKAAVTDDQIYRNLDWLADQQKEVEKKLWSYHAKGQETHLFLYDVTSTYLEGEKNEWAAYGYNRDGKKGKKQIVIGLLTNGQGFPLKITVYEGNTSDTKTFGDQVKASAEEFGVQEITFVGDRGMIKGPQIANLPEGCSYITAMGKQEIQTLITKQTLQLSLFDAELKEVVDRDTGLRYILRRNPMRQEEIRDNRRARIKKILALVQERNQYLVRAKKAKIETAHKLIQGKIEQYKLSAFLKIEDVVPGGKDLRITLDRKVFKESSALDGCYVIKSNVDKSITAEVVHSRYKDLKYVEDGFRTMKQSHLELRPVYVRKKERTAAHVFIVMLSYMIIRQMRLLLASEKETILAKEVIDSLGLIALHHLGTEKTEKELDTTAKPPLYKLPTPSDLNQSYLNRLKIKLPEMFIHGMSVAKPKTH